MNDCTNAEIRDQLPDLLHERLDDRARAVVMAHVGDCVDCRDELRLLGEVRMAIEARAPRVDLAYVVSALPKPPRPGLARVVPRRHVWADWRVAAAVTLLVAGGSSIALLDHGASTTRTDGANSVAATAVSTPAISSASAAAAGNPVNETASAERSAGMASIAEPAVATADPQPAATDAATDVASDANLSNLDATQLKTLLQDLDNLPAVPIADPAPVSLRISAQTSGDL